VIFFDVSLLIFSLKVGVDIYKCFDIFILTSFQYLRRMKILSLLLVCMCLLSTNNI